MVQKFKKNLNPIHLDRKEQNRTQTKQKRYDRTCRQQNIRIAICVFVKWRISKVNSRESNTNIIKRSVQEGSKPKITQLEINISLGFLSFIFVLWSGQKRVLNERYLPCQYLWRRIVSPDRLRLQIPSGASRETPDTYTLRTLRPLLGQGLLYLLDLFKKVSWKSVQKNLYV